MIALIAAIITFAVCIFCLWLIYYVEIKKQRQARKDYNKYQQMCLREDLKYYEGLKDLPINKAVKDFKESARAYVKAKVEYYK